MKKGIFAVIIAYISLTVSVSAYHINNNDMALGVAFSYPMNTSISFRMANFPIINLGWSDNNTIGVTVDYWFEKGNLRGSVDYYIGIGGYGVFYNGTKDSKNVGLGARLPIGLQIIPSNHIEIFGEVSPSLLITPSLKPDIFGTVGIRYIF